MNLTDLARQTGKQTDGQLMHTDEVIGYKGLQNKKY